MSDTQSTRRDVLLQLAAGAGAVAALGSAASAEEGSGSHDGQGSHDGAGGSHGDLLKSASRCLYSGEVCIAHCIASLGKGDTSLKDCLQRVQEMMSACGTLVRFAALDSPRLKQLAKLCIDVCDDCEKECRKHEKHHEVCRACAESCKDCSSKCNHLIKV